MSVAKTLRLAMVFKCECADPAHSHFLLFGQQIPQEAISFAKQNLAHCKRINFGSQPGMRIRIWSLVLAQILQVIFGQQLPDEATSFAQQSFAVSVAAIGLAAFALVLALVEQVVLQVVDENVARGSARLRDWACASYVL